MKEGRNRIGLLVFNLTVMLALFQPGGISASSTQPAPEGVTSNPDTNLAQDDSATDMRINEVMFCPDAGGYEWVELKHTGSSAMNIDGWGLTDEDGNWYKFPQALPEVPAGDFVVISFDGLDSASMSTSAGTVEQTRIAPSDDLLGSTTARLMLSNTVVITGENTVYAPLVVRQAPPPWIDPSDRQVSLDYFNETYRASDGVPIGWTGNHASCNAGETSMAFREAVRLRINYFRAMAGVPAVVQLSDEYTDKAQQAALMMSVNGQLSHTPGPTWLCYTPGGAQAAGSSNLYLGVYGPSAISGYIEDFGNGNYPVGHRRWILYPQTQWMGTGDIPPTGGYWSSNALWVFDENMWEPRPQTREEYVAWPPPGYVPYRVVFPRWSLAYDEADFSAATVEMSSGGESIPLTVKPVVNGYGENTLVWEPDLSYGAPPSSDTAYDVIVSGVEIHGVPRDFTYQVVLFDPEPLAGLSAGGYSGLLDEPPVSR